MRTVELSLRYRSAKATREWLRTIPGSGTAYLTDSLYRWRRCGGRDLLYPGGREGWTELPRPGDLEAAEQAARVGCDLLYKFPSRGRRRVFYRAPA